MAKVLLQININNLRIADIDTGSAVAIGNNYFYEWKTNSKTNNGLGRLSGDSNSIADTLFSVDDPDYQDMICCESLSRSALHKLIEGAD